MQWVHIDNYVLEAMLNPCSLHIYCDNNIVNVVTLIANVCYDEDVCIYDDNIVIVAFTGDMKQLKSPSQLVHCHRRRHHVNDVTIPFITET